MKRTLFPFLAGLAGVAMFATASLAATERTYERISGPYTAQNISLYFLHGPSAPGAVPLTLGEALKGGAVTVYETGQVSRLAIENKGDREVFIQAGDIVKGGRQDRVLSASLLIPPRSGRVPIGAFCVEQGRWRKRGLESSAKFHSASTVLPLKAAKLAMALPAEKTPQRYVRRPQRAGRAQQAVGPSVRIQEQRRIAPSLQTPGQARQLTRQQRVWASVGAMQGKLSRNLKAEVTSSVSASSLQLTLENKKVTEARTKLAAALKGEGERSDDIVGFVFAINGKINSGDVYPSNGLFRKMWPRLLAAAVTEAIAEKKDARAKPDVPHPSDVRTFLASAADETPTVQKLDTRLDRETRVAKGKAVMTSTRRRGGREIHRSFVAY